MSVVFSRPYQFMAPHRSRWWPALIHRFRLPDWHLRRNEGVVDYELRNVQRFRDSVDAGHGILLAPNHCRYADPIALGWLARAAQTHVYAMASWHLYNKSWFDSFALKRMGGFSIYREGSDRQALETAIGMLATVDRPLILFPEGTTNRTNDVLKPLLDGVPFIARAAARKRQKTDGGKVVIHPIGMKYLCVGDITPWASEQLSELERRIGWRPTPGRKVVDRTTRMAEGMLALKEVEHFGTSKTGDLRERRNTLMEYLLSTVEAKYGIDRADSSDPLDQSARERVRKIRSEVASQYFAGDWQSSATQARRPEMENDVAAADLAQDLLSFPDCYLVPGEITDSRIVETIQRLQESVYGKASDTMPLKVVIEVDEAIDVPTEKPPRGQPDPISGQLTDRLTSMLAKLSREALPYAG